MGKFRWTDYTRLGGGDSNLKENKIQNWFPVYVSHDLSSISLSKQKGWKKVFPVTDAGIKRTWNTSKETFEKNINAGNVRAFVENGQTKIFRKLRATQTIKTHWDNPKYNATKYGTQMLNGLVGSGSFSYPKSVYAVLDFLKITTKKNSVVLDFFAGSGTTGHAVSLLNKEDGGNRRFILCTNNENGIAREVCRPRIKSVIKGHPNYPDITGIPSNLKYFKTAFVTGAATNPTDKNKAALTLKAAQMLCVKEGTYELVKETAAYKIFRNLNRYTGIIYKATAIKAFKKAITKIDGQFSVYIFSFTDEDFSDEFADTKQKTKLQPIPEVILRTYRQIFK